MGPPYLMSLFSFSCGGGLNPEGKRGGVAGGFQPWPPEITLQVSWYTSTYPSGLSFKAVTSRKPTLPIPLLFLSFHQVRKAGPSSPLLPRSQVSSRGSFPCRGREPRVTSTGDVLSTSHGPCALRIRALILSLDLPLWPGSGQ